MKISDLASGLTLDSAGIWASGDRVEVSYPTDGNEQCYQVEDSSFWFKHRNSCIIAALRSHAPSGTILDVGGGNGFVTRRMLDEGFDAALVEPGLTGAFNARTQRHIPDVFCSTLEGCGFPSDSIDAISLFDVLEHVESDVSFLSEVHDVLKPGGNLYLTVPAFKWLWSESDESAGHHRRYSPQLLADLLGNHFDILFMTCFFQALTLPILAYRVLPYRLGLAKHRNSAVAENRAHGSSGGVMVKAVERLLAPEIRRITCSHSVGWGTSCLCVARKVEGREKRD
jgi:SAM-dependent methyltransferase